MLTTSPGSGGTPCEDNFSISIVTSVPPALMVGSGLTAGMRNGAGFTGTLTMNALYFCVVGVILVNAVGSSFAFAVSV